jgi:spore coat polysaccharide biosynthesis protein SpsF
MTTIAVVQARMGSTRLPGKVLMDLGGRPALELMLERLSPALGEGLDRLVVATSTLPNDDPVAETAEQAGFDVVRGSEGDVLARFVSALDVYPADTVVRLTADCPLADPEIVIRALDVHGAAAADYTSNTLVRTFPDGLDVEVVAAHALRAAGAEAKDPVEREHVTPFVYRRPERFVLRAFRSGADLGDERWTVDTPHDLDDIRQVIARVESPTNASWRDVLAVTGVRRRPAAGQLWLRPYDTRDQAHLAELGRTAPQVQVGHPDDVAWRTWTAEVDAIPRGWIGVAVRDGVGRLRWSLPDADLVPVRHLLADRLSADCQVVTLVED